jgi:hypothetical protein
MFENLVRQKLFKGWTEVFDQILWHYSILSCDDANIEAMPKHLFSDPPNLVEEPQIRKLGTSTELSDR